jgi:hypothetical protein
MFKVISRQLSVINNRLSTIDYRLFTILLVLIFFFIATEPAVAQCPMCKASAEASIKGGSNVAKGLNKGILYLLAMPYLLFTVIFFMWYKNYRKKVVVG